nr:hypothetical protein Iba_chr14aCG25870 [Ipomoea batatas]
MLLFHPSPPTLCRQGSALAPAATPEHDPLAPFRYPFSAQDQGSKSIQPFVEFLPPLPLCNQVLGLRPLPGSPSVLGIVLVFVLITTSNFTSLKCPSILPSDLFLLLGCEVIFDVECFADLLWCLPLDHISNSLTGKIQQALDVEIKERCLVNFDEIGVKGLEIIITGLVLSLRSRLNMAFTVLNNLSQDLASDIREGDNSISAVVLNHVLDRLRLERHRLFDLESFTVGTLQNDHL